jgi:hypothetical protein
MCAKSFENPLIPHKRLREMYTALVETRVIGKQIRHGFGRGTEACWVGAAIGLRDSEGDYVSAGAAEALVDYTLGGRLKDVLADVAKDTLTPLARMWFALGAASKIDKGKVVLAFMGADDLGAADWKRVLGEALRLDLPIVFVAIPEKRSESGVADLALKFGVPGIPLDANDAVAMYRVAQESIGRARAGGGPALIEGINFSGSGVFPAARNPVPLLAKQLIAKGVATQAWIDKVEPRIQAKLTR